MFDVEIYLKLSMFVVLPIFCVKCKKLQVLENYMTFGECEVSFFFFFAICVYKVVNLNYLEFVISICHQFWPWSMSRIFLKFSLHLHSEVVIVCFSNHY